MLDQISPDIMRAYARYTPSGQPKDIDRENLRRFQRSGRQDMLDANTLGRPRALAHIGVWSFSSLLPRERSA